MRSIISKQSLFYRQNNKPRRGSTILASNATISQLSQNVTSTQVSSCETGTPLSHSKVSAAALNNVNSKETGAINSTSFCASSNYSRNHISAQLLLK